MAGTRRILLIEMEENAHHTVRLDQVLQKKGKEKGRR